jgi:hypothetical protein
LLATTENIISINLDFIKDKKLQKVYLYRLNSTKQYFIKYWGSREKKAIFNPNGTYKS